ncbi:MAG TPA: response regulator [Thermoanaerobaculia bacterium]
MPKKILLADDSLTIQKVVELTLAGTDYELTCVSNGQKALESLDHWRPDLILADVVMPGKNGYEVCEAVKSNPATARIPVVLLSGTFEPFDRDRADRIGADRIVSKPFDAQQLLDEIETLLTRAASTSSPASAFEEGPFDTAFLDDTVPTAREPGESEPSEAENPFEHLSPLPPPSLAELRRKSPGEGQSLSSDWSFKALAKEEGLAEEGEGSAIAEAELTGVEEFSGGPVFLPPPDTQAAAEEAETRHPVEETSSEPPRAEPSPERVGVEEISTEAAETLFEVPAAPPPPPPASPAPAATELTQEQIERIAALVVAKLSDRVLREIAWEVVPDVAEMVVKRRIEELESGTE